jgi:hypothetical protein
MGHSIAAYHETSYFETQVVDVIVRVQLVRRPSMRLMLSAYSSAGRNVLEVVLCLRIRVEQSKKADMGPCYTGLTNTNA